MLKENCMHCKVILVEENTVRIDVRRPEMKFTCMLCVNCADIIGDIMDESNKWQDTYKKS